MHARIDLHARDHRRHRLLASAALLLIAALVAHGAQVGSSSNSVHALLRTEGQFTEGDLAALERDQAVARVLRDTDRRELAAFGVVRVHVPYSFLLGRIRNIVSFKRNAMVLQIGRFSTPPRIEDLADLTLDRDDIEALRRCRPGDCALRLPAADIDRIRTGVDWRTSGASAAATRLMREFLLHRVQAYLAGGIRALGEYADKRPAINVADEFDRLLAAPGLLREVPELLRYVQLFPSDAPANTDHFLYWSKERFGFKPVISVTHLTIYEPHETALIKAYATSKQIYASHYFDAALAVTAVIPRRAADGSPAFYMMYVNRSRTPLLEGFFATLARGAVRGRTRDGLVETLRVTKERLESDFQHSRN